ncbi:MAG: class I SAM-dependent methyltransferase [Patescibacteria group bacterium]
MQEKHGEWAWQWANFPDVDEWLFSDWIAPVTLEDFRGKRVLDAGCGGGQYLSLVAPYAREAIGVDLNTAHIAAERNRIHPNVRTVEGDIALASFPEPFDLVYCIGVIHHTDDPDATFRNLAAQTAQGGRTVVWAYSHEGNFLNRTLVEGMKRLFVLRLPKGVVRAIAYVLATLMYLPICTLYLLPLAWLPYFEYFRNWRKLTYRMNVLNVFDKLNAPQTHFIKRDRIERWFVENGYRDIRILPYRGVSWHGDGVKV